MTIIDTIEKLGWNELQKYAGIETATYYRANAASQEITVVKSIPKPDSLNYEEYLLYQDRYIFETEKAKFVDELPKDDDVIEIENTRYRVIKTNYQSAWWDVGVSGLTLQINTVLLR
jgi:hypothetical protein